MAAIRLLILLSWLWITALAILQAVCMVRCTSDATVAFGEHQVFTLTPDI
jgi:hypothetical protein